MKNYIAAAALIGLFASSAMAQTGSQTYTASVPVTITLTAPTVPATLTHDESDNDQPFPAQQWSVSGNTTAGVTVSFTTDQAFTNTLDATFERDARLDLALATNSGPATWTVGTPQDQTDFGANDGVAAVQASSNGVGLATFDLTVTFVTDQYGTFAAGDYETTVTGTVTAN